MKGESMENKTAYERMIHRLLKENPKDVYNDLLEHDADFRAFIDSNAGKTSEEMYNTYLSARWGEYGKAKEI